MNCEQGLSLINARMDGELQPDDGHRLSAHLGECANCRSAVYELERDDRELARMFNARQRAATEVADQVLEEWFAETTLPSRRWAPMKWASAAAAGFALAFLLYGPRSWESVSGGNEIERVHALVEDWKQSDAPHEVEVRLRSLGSACATPLAEALQTWKGDPDNERRVGVARVLCDLADFSQIPTLIDLLGDDSFEVRTLSEASLVRLTGRRRVDLPGPALAQAGSCSNPQAEWREWWNQNKDRFERPDG